MTRRRRYGARGALPSWSASSPSWPRAAVATTSSSSAQEGLGGSLEEMQSLAKEEGQVNLVIWPGYADKSWTDTFTANTGCKVNTKDGGTSDDMIDLLASGEYDGLSASGNASVRLMAKGDVSPVNTELLPNYADVIEGIKNQSYNSKDGEPFGAPHGRGPNLLVYRTDEVTPAPDSWAPIWDGTYSGKSSIYDDSIFIADAAVYLKATQPDLGIEDPYQLNEEQFNAAVDLLKKLAPTVGEWWADYAKQIQSLTNKDERDRHDVALPGGHARRRQAARRRRSSRRKARPVGRTRG